MRKWWMERIGYQIYIKSFYDSNEDGIGDINGITKKLLYLKDLGINLIWIGPFYKSPMDDNGYDVSDFYSVSEEFGTIDDFKKLIKVANDLDIKIILDFVLNHTSDEHPWFIESRSSLDNPKRDYYIWQTGREIDGKLYPPTNWGSFFSGSAWNYDPQTKQYYMKIFSNKMPDLNWENEKVRKEMLEVGKWWLDLGISGFRIDAVSHLEKAPFIDSKYGDKRAVVLDWHKFSNLPKVHKYLKELNAGLFSKYDALTIGEVGGGAAIESALKYSAFDSNQLSMVFNFDHNWSNNLNLINDYKDLKTDVLNLKKVFNDWQIAFKNRGFIPLNWLNHDQPRLMSHYGNSKYFNESAKMLATSMYMSRGVPFVYQGEEIGMTNYPFTKMSEFRDVSSFNYYHSMQDSGLTEDEKIWQVKKTSRDNPRTPMQWSSQENAGFSTTKPWININPNYQKINVETQLEDSNSILNHYKKIFDLRLKSIYRDLIIYGEYKQVDLENQDVYIYEREDLTQKLIIINSFSEQEINYDLSIYQINKVVLSNYQETIINNNIITLRPFESLVMEVEK